MIINTASWRMLLLAGISALAVAAEPFVANAQSVDYGSLEQLYGEPVTTSATGKPQKASEVPANMVIVTQDDIRRSGADNLPDILQYVVGLDLRRYGFASADVAVRGMNQPWNPRLLVLINGRQVYSDDYDFVPWEALPVELGEIRQIEIVKGPNSALFGFNAVSGVVNIITYDPLYDNVNQITGMTGTQSLREGSVITTLHKGTDAGVRVSAGGDMADEYYHSIQYANPAVNPMRGSINAQGKWAASPGVVVDLQASEVSSYDAGLNSVARFNNTFYRTNDVRGSVSDDTRIGVLGLDIYRNGVIITAPQVPPLAGQSTSSLAAPSSWQEEIYVTRATDVLRLNDTNTLRFAGEYRDNSLDTNPFFKNGGLVNGSIGEQLISGSTMWDWQITPTLSLTNAARIDYLALNREGSTSNNGWTNANYDDVRHTEYSFNSGLVYKLSPDDTIRLTAARGIQVASLIDLDSTGSGNPNIQPSVVMNYELGYDRSLAIISSVLQTSVFYQTDDEIINRLGGPKVVVPSRSAKIAGNVGTANEKGVEIGIKGSAESGLRWNASYSFESVTQDLIVNVTGVATSPLLLTNGTPQHVIIAGGGYTWGKLELDAQVRWQSRYEDFNAALTNPVVMIPDFITSTARIGYRLTDNLTLALSGSQLGQNRLIEATGPAIERRIIASATLKF
jgi:iron complex outermembrane receptor protein